MNWFADKWRPASAWVYLLICLFDFMIAPILWNMMQLIVNSAVQTQWQPLTLIGGGLMHVSFGAMMGITSLGRTKEKLANKA
tara:strand:- start:64 stop:309 length:246 start_codon:yes stop_codon:yes gene_type:complete